MIVKTLA